MLSQPAIIKIVGDVTVVVHKDISPSSITINVSDNGFLDSTVHLIAAIGSQQDALDIVTGWKLFKTKNTFHLFNGSLGNINDSLDLAVSNGIISTEEAKLNKDALLPIYKSMLELFNIIYKVKKMQYGKDVDPFVEIIK